VSASGWLALFALGFITLLLVGASQPQPSPLTQNPSPLENPSLTATAKTGCYGYVAAFSDADTTFIATNFDLFIFNPDLTSDAAATAVKAKNINVKTYAYRELHMMYSGYDDWATVDANEAWFLHTALGDRIQNTGSGWWLMDAGNVDWQAHFVDHANTTYLNTAAYDGLFADDVHDEYPDWWTLSGEVQAADKASWHADVLGMLQYIQANLLGGKELLINTDESGTYDYIGVADAMMIEGAVHPESADSSSFNSTAYTMAQIDDLAYVAGSLNKKVYFQSGTSSAITDAMVKYCFAGMLLGCDGTYTYFGFNDWEDSETGYNALMATALGSPAGAYALSSNVYQRTFTGGKVLFNPSVNEYIVALGTTYYLSDNTAVTSVTLAAHTAEIVFNSATPSSTSGVSFSTLWSTVLAKIEAQGISCDVTLKTLSLGAADATTGQYSQYYADSTIKMIMEGANGQFSVLGAGTHNQLSAKGHTNSAVHDGDVIEDDAGFDWKILSAVPIYTGDILLFYNVALSRVMDGVGLGTTGYAPGKYVGTAVPAILKINSVAWTEIDVFPEAYLQGIGWVEIESGFPVASLGGVGWVEIESGFPVADLATSVSVTPYAAAKWLIDCAYHILGTITPQGWQTLASGATQAVSAVADTANGYVIASATPYSLDSGAYTLGVVDSAGTASYTVPAQTDNTLHQIRCSYALGWGSYSATPTPTGYSYNASAATRNYTAVGSPPPGEHWHIWLDGTTDLGHSPANVPAQTNGSYHVITQVSTL